MIMNNTRDIHGRDLEGLGICPYYCGNIGYRSRDWAFIDTRIPPGTECRMFKALTSAIVRNSPVPSPARWTSRIAMRIVGELSAFHA